MGHRQRFKNNRHSVHLDQQGYPKEFLVRYTEPRVPGRLNTKEQSNAILIAQKSVRASAEDTTSYTVFSTFRVLDQITIVEDQPHKVPPTRVGKQSMGVSTEGNDRFLVGQSDSAGVQRLYSGEGKTCLYVHVPARDQ